MQNTTKPEFKVGDGVTVVRYSDLEPYTVIAVTKNTITIQEDKAVLLNGFSSGEADAIKSYPGGFLHHVEGIQRYEITPNPEGYTVKAHWRESKGAFFSPCGKVIAGRAAHYDYNF